jgi:hypothetical protein
MYIGIWEIGYTTGHPSQTEEVHWKETNINTDKRASKMYFT